MLYCTLLHERKSAIRDCTWDCVSSEHNFRCSARAHNPGQRLPLEHFNRRYHFQRTTETHPISTSPIHRQVLHWKPAFLHLKSMALSIFRSKSIPFGLLVVCIHAVIFSSIGNLWFFQSSRHLSPVNTPPDFDIEIREMLRKQPRVEVEKVEISNYEAQSRIGNRYTTLPPQYLLNKPFYVYEELLWLNATANEETIETMILRGYTWKHNDDLWFVNAALKHPMRTRNPEEAVLFVIPSFLNIFLSPYHHENPCFGDLCGMDALLHVDKVLGQSPWFQRNQGKDHVVVASIFSASMKLATFPNLVKCNMIALENRKWNNDDRYSVPSYYVGSPCLPRKKEYDFAMVATIKRQFTFESRRHICEWLREERPQYSMSACGLGDQCPALAQARFGFHVRGDTYGANRLIDTILTGTVPIFTMKEQYEILPDWIRWDDFSYFADVNNKEAFLKAIDDIVNDEAMYQQKYANLMANRDLFDWQTHVPFDTYMYMFMAQIYPEFRRPDADSPFGALQLSKPDGFDAFDSEKKQVWCGDSGPAKHCGECNPLFDSRSRGCQRMCRWCEFGYEESEEQNEVLIPGVCVPLHYKCRTVDFETIMESTVRPYQPVHEKKNWCVPATSDEDGIQGLLLAKTYKTGSSTAAAVTLQIAHRVAKRRGMSTSCMAHTSHDLSVFNAIVYRDYASSVLWTTVRDPSKRALSAFAFYRAGKNKEDASNENLIEFLEGAKNNQIAQLRINRVMSAPGGQPTDVNAIPQSTSDVVTILKEEISGIYDFIAVTERMEESLVVLKMLWNLRHSDIIVSSIKQAGDWSYDWDHPETCFYVPEIGVSPVVQKYLDTDFRHDNYDYHLHEFANRSLDATIDALGRERVEQEVIEHVRLKKQALRHCRHEIRRPCSSRGEWQPEFVQNCFQDDIGCGYRCINNFLDQYEQGMKRFGGLTTNSETKRRS